MADELAVRQIDAIVEAQSVQRPDVSLVLTPVMDIQTAKKRLAEFQAFVQGYLKEGEDYGTIPGTPKPTLYKPGADKLCELYGLADTYKIDKLEDFKADPPLFDYSIECTLWRGDRLVSTGWGSCNSYECKFKYRDAKRKCPVCGQATVIKGKEEFGGGWLCWKKAGKSDGCGMKWPDGAKEIEDQPQGKLVNDDIPTLKNTILKMALKRAKISATLSATRSSGVFTQDMEDINPEANGEGSQRAADAVAKKKIEEHNKRAAESVKDKNVEVYEILHEQTGEQFLVFVRSQALAVLLDGGLKDIAKLHPTRKEWFIPDVADIFKLVGKVCASYGFTLKRRPSAAKPAPNAAASSPATAPSTPQPKTIRSTEVKSGKKGEYLVVRYGNDQTTAELFCFNRDLWDDIAKAQGKTAVFLTKPSGKWMTITGIERLGGQTWSEIDGKYAPDVQVSSGYDATDEDLPEIMR